MEIYHQTGLDAALSILRSATIFGGDGFAVPNFSLIEGDSRNNLEGCGIAACIRLARRGPEYLWDGRLGAECPLSPILTGNGLQLLAVIHPAWLTGALAANRLRIVT